MLLTTKIYKRQTNTNMYLVERKKKKKTINGMLYRYENIYVYLHHICFLDFNINIYIFVLLFEEIVHKVEILKSLPKKKKKK